jgi:hypothetical protein
MLLHNTKRWNQPWKTGLPVDFTPAANTPLSRALSWVRQVPQTLFGRYAMLGHYRAHWDPNQERFFFGLLRECLDKGVVSEQMLRAEIAAQPRPPRRPRGDRAHAAARRLSRSPPSTPGIPPMKPGRRPGGGAIRAEPAAPPSKRRSGVEHGARI